MVASIQPPTGGAIEYSAGEAYDQTSAGSKWLFGFKEGDRERKIVFVNAPGEQGAGSQDFRYDTQSFDLDVTYVQSDDEDCVAAFQKDLALMCQVTTITVGSTVFSCCRLVSSKGEQSRPASFGHTVYKRCTLRFISGRPGDEEG